MTSCIQLFFHVNVTWSHVAQHLVECWGLDMTRSESSNWYHGIVEACRDFRDGISTECSTDQFLVHILLFCFFQHFLRYVHCINVVVSHFLQGDSFQYSTSESCWTASCEIPQTRMGSRMTTGCHKCYVLQLRVDTLGDIDILRSGKHNGITSNTVDRLHIIIILSPTVTAYVESMNSPEIQNMRNAAFFVSNLIPSINAIVRQWITGIEF